MISRTPRFSNTRRDSGYWVEAPRVTDAIGSSLRKAYARDVQITEELDQLLQKLGYNKFKGNGSSSRAN